MRKPRTTFGTNSPENMASRRSTVVPGGRMTLQVDARTADDWTGYPEFRSFGGTGPDTAREALRWYELRRRIEDRRLDHDDDLGKCLAFDAITAFRVWDLAHLARERPDDPATWHVT